MLVVTQGAAQEAQIIKGQDQHNHAAQSNTADPSVKIEQKLNKDPLERGSNINQKYHQVPKQII